MKRIALLAALACTVAAAQTTPSGAAPSTADIKAARARADAERARVFGTTAPVTDPAKRMPTDPAIQAEIARGQKERRELFDRNNPSLRKTPNVFPNVPTPERGSLDIEAIAQRYEAKTLAKAGDGLMVFASFSMPPASLTRLIQDTAKAGGTVILRGFKEGSLKATSEAVASLGAPTSAVQINPDAFGRYRIQAVPAVVLARIAPGQQLDGEGCALPADFVRVSGDVRLAFALDRIAAEAPAWGAIAKRHRATLGTQP